MTEKIEYICDSNWEIFKNRLAVKKGSATKNGLTIIAKGWSNVVACEVYDSDKFVFVSNRSSFTLDEEPTSIKVYAIAFDGSRTELIW